MTWYADGTTYEYLEAPSQALVNVGWLDGEHQYTRGVVPEGFLERLALLCQRRVNATRGWHGCELCGNSGPVIVERHSYRLELGSAEIRVPGWSGQCSHAAPNLIYHYVEAHNYKPADEFIQSVLTLKDPV